MKPFCSGGRADVRLLRAMQDVELTEDQINPFYFPEPVAPLVSARQRNHAIPLREVVRRIKEIAARCECLLIEGSGGLLVPLGENSGTGVSPVRTEPHRQDARATTGEIYLVSDLIRALDCEVIVVSRNRLGTINHTLLSVSALKNLGIKPIAIALMSVNNTDPSCATNEKILTEFLAPVPVRAVKFLGKNANKIRALQKNYKKIKKTLALFFP